MAAKGSHVVQPVGYLDEYYPDVVAHGEQQFLERLCLCRSLVAEDSARNLGQSVHYLCYLGSEDIADVLYGVVGVLHHVVQQGGTDARAAKPYLLAGYLRHGYGVHDIWLSRQPSHPLVCLLCKVEGLVYDVNVLAMSRHEVGLYQMLVRLVHHPLILLLFRCQLFHTLDTYIYR